MSRKIIALIVASLTLFALLPAGMALAAPTATSSITLGASGYPGDRTMAVTVNNTAAGLTGERITTVRLSLPVAETGMRAVAGNAGTNAGWTGVVTQAGSTSHFITYTATGAIGGIAPGASFAFNFPVTVARPLRSDRTGPITVQVSSGNAAATNAQAATAGALNASVKILEVVAGSLAPVAPTNADNSKGVTDRTGTAGQTITYAFGVKNYAQEAVSVTGTMKAAAANSPDVVDPTKSSQTVTAAGNDAVTTFNVPVTLGAADGGDRAATFEANATGTSSSGPSAAPTPRTDSFTIQKPVDLAFSNLNPTRVKPGVSKTFSLRASKTGTPAFDLTSSTMSFAGNTATLDGGGATFARGASSPTLSYTTTSIITGTNGSKAVSVANIGGDDNLASYSLTRDAGNLILDTLIPTITVVATLPKDADQHQQVATKNGDTITVSGTMSADNGSTISDSNDLDLTTLKVVLQPDQGPAIPVTVAPTTSGNGGTFTGTVKVADWKQPTATGGPFSPSTFVASATIADKSGNGAGASSPASAIDLVLPKLDGAAGQAVVLSPTEIRTRFIDATGVRGGCDPAMWLIDGAPARVSKVRNGDGTDCNPAALSDGVRILVLDANRPLDVDETPSVTYDLAGMRQLMKVPAKDGAGNDALRQTIQTVTDILPVKPSIVSVERKDGSAYEDAYLDTTDSRYYTNAGGAEGIKLTFGGARTNYTIQVLDGANNVLVSRKITKTSSNPFAREFEDETFIPLGTTDAAYARKVRFLSGTGNAGPTQALTLVLDSVVPALANASLQSPTTVQAKFSEAVVAGSDYWDDWFVSETVDTENGPADYVTNATQVTSVDSQTRLLTVDLRDSTRYRNAYYLLTSAGTRYEDRAGNTLANSVLP